MIMCCGRFRKKCNMFCREKFSTLWRRRRKLKIAQFVATCLFNDAIYSAFLWYLWSHHAFIFIAMKVALLLVFALLYHCEGAVFITSDAVNDRPFIGVLAQEQSFYLHGKFPEENYTSYIAASYVKDVESAGARVVPIMIGKDRAYYEDILSKINGVLIPGGATYFNQSGGYADAGQHIYEIAMELNDAGDYFPIFGTCLGFELLVILASGRGEPENRITCYSMDVSLPLEFKDDFRDSKLFRNAPDDIVKILATEDVTANAHQFCITEDNLKSHNLTEDWKVLSVNDDEYGVEFISSFEHTRYPFYGVQFHPEKIAFEWKLSKKYNHSQSSLKANRYFMDFFISESRRNWHAFANASEENKYVIWNYEPTFTGVLGSAYHQCYMFEPRGRPL